MKLRYYLNIGTNLGHRRANLMRAIAALSAGCGGCMVSAIVESEPWGFDSPNGFLNVGVALSSALQPLDMLHHIHSIEQRLGSDAHRDAQGRYQDRLIDIDIVDIRRENGEPVTVATPALTVPHPHLQERPFFLIPLQQLLHEK